MKKIVEFIKLSSEYQKNIEYGTPRPGHPEGKLKFHIADLEANLEKLKNKGITHEQYWKLQFLIHVHDLFKIEELEGSPPFHTFHHATLAKKFASRFTDDEDLLSMIQFHDENYYLWLEFKKNGKVDKARFDNLLKSIKDWNLFLLFVIIDGCTKGKDYRKLEWFINEVKKHRATRVESNWVLDPQ